MSATTASASSNVWEAIDTEKRRDRFIRKVSITSWTITFLLVVALGFSAPHGIEPWISCGAQGANAS